MMTVVSGKKGTAPPGKMKSLRITFVISFLVLSIIIILTNTLIISYYYFKSQETAMTDRLHLIVQDAAHNVKIFLSGKMNMLKASVKLSNLIDMSKNEQINFMRKLMGNDISIRQLLLISADYEEIVHVSLVAGSFDTYLKERMKSIFIVQDDRRSLYISSVYIDRASFEPLVGLAVPVTDVFGDIASFILAEINLKFMWNLVADLDIGKNGYAYVVDKQGTLIAYKDIGRVIKGENVRHLHEVNEFITNKHLIDHRNKIESSKGINNTTMVTTYIPLNIPDWAVVIELPYREAYKTFINTQIVSAIVMMCSILLAIVISIIISKKITRPVIELRDSVRKIRTTDANVLVPVMQNNEIGELAVSFNEMIERLRLTTVSRDSLVVEINERKKAEEKLKEYVQEIEYINKELDDFTYIVSHDLKEPLRSIDAFSKFLENDYKDLIDEDGKNYLNRIRMNSRRMQKLIEDLLEVSRLGRKEYPMVHIPVKEIIEEVKMRFEHILNKKNVLFKVQADLPVIDCDRIRLTEAFANIILNAIKFNDKPDPVIEIGYKERKEEYEFFVKDNGPGISEQYFLKIFEIFQRLGRKNDSSGTGAGLAIVKKIIQLHNGKIWVESEINKGTVFIFTIPKNIKSKIMSREVANER